MSSTSQTVPCNSSFCEHQGKCSVGSSQCPYNVEYVSENTSSSGFLVEDLLYLTTEGTTPKVVKAPIMFGYVAFTLTGILEKLNQNKLV